MLYSYEPRFDFGMSEVAAKVRREAEEDREFVNESLSDVLRPMTLAALLAVPGIVDAAALSKAVGASADGKPVQVSDPNIQKKIYNIIGKDKYEDAVIVNVIARTLMGEAVGENSTEAFDAVASVIWNRAGGRKAKFVDTILKPLQFSCWNKLNRADKRNFVIKPHGRALTNPAAWKYCVSLAKRMVDGDFTPVGNWNHYYAHNKVNPSWASKLKGKKVIGNHTFGTV